MLTSPFSQHVISADTISQYVDENNRFHSEKLIRKRGRIPNFARPFLGNISESWILETCVVDPNTGEMQTLTRNLDHTFFLKVEENTVYRASGQGSTHVEHSMSFSSNFGRWGIKERIEDWCYKHSQERIQSSRRGMAFVMEQVRNMGVKAYTQMQWER